MLEFPQFLEFLLFPGFSMELRQYWKIAFRWWWLILLPPLVAGTYGLATYRPPATTYAASLRFTAGQPESGDVPAERLYDPNYYRWLTSEYIVGGLKDWARTGAFAEAVSAELAARGVTLPAGAINGAISTDNARSILIVYLSWGNPDQLPALAEAVSKVLQEQNADAFPQLGGQAAVVVPLDKPGIGSVPPSLRARFDLLLKIGLGLAVGITLALAAHYFDPFVREREELERMGVQVIAEIPREKR
jgi:capsular polysaccharide biosynthesis protein